MQQEPGAAPTILRATGHAGNPPGQGPFMRISLGVSGGVVREAAYETYQCPGCVACGQGMVSLVKDRPLEEVRGIRHEHLVAQVGPLPKHRQICYGLAVLALDESLKRLGEQGGFTWPS